MTDTGFPLGRHSTMSEFVEAAAKKDTGTFSPSKCEVNHVWINREAHAPEGSDISCGVPLRYLDKVFKNAEKYKDAQFNVWIDKNLLDGLSLFFVDSHAYMQKGIENLSIRSLRDIEEYDQFPLFNNPDKSNLFLRTDLARLIVMKHVMENSDKKIVMYSDFDADDVSLGNPDVQARLDTFGMSFCDTECGLTNGYIALDRNRGKEFLTNNLIPHTKDAVSKGHDTIIALRNCLDKWMRDTGMWDVRHNCDNESYKDLAVNVLRELNYQTPVNPLYSRIGLDVIRDISPPH